MYSVTISFTELPLVHSFDEFMNTATIFHGELSRARALELIQALLLEFGMEAYDAPTLYERFPPTSQEELAMGPDNF